MRKTTILLSLFFLTLPRYLYAIDFPHRCESKHFTIYYQQGVDPLDAAYKVNIGGSIYFYKNRSKTVSPDSEPKEILTQNIDILFNEVSDLLDMHLYTYRGSIKICLNKEELKKTFYEIFNRELKFESFYYHTENAIYISLESLRPGILAHEIAHAIINHYFVVMPPMRVQEVLAGYVEYTINKKSQKNGR